ncbi:hypothetical protein RNT98_12975, partial [Staphylococcus pseudintermedius]
AKRARSAPALWSSLLTPALIVLASLPAMLGGEHWELAARVIAVALAPLLAPVASWLLVRWLHGRSTRA